MLIASPVQLFTACACWCWRGFVLRPTWRGNRSIVIPYAKR
jgi:hypothetical protein